MLTWWAILLFACASIRPAGSPHRRVLMREIAYVVRGFLTVRRDSLRIPLSGSLTVRADPDSGLFSGDLTLHQSTINRAAPPADRRRGVARTGRQARWVH